jgi:transposase
VLNRTFGCVRVVWNQTLAARQQQYVTDRTTTSYAQTDRALTAMKKDPAFAFSNEVAAVPLQQTLRPSTRPSPRFSPSAPATRGSNRATLARARTTPGRRSPCGRRPASSEDGRPAAVQMVVA